MKKVKWIFTAMLAMMLLVGSAAAQEVFEGSIPARGVIFDLTQEDIDMGLTVSTYMDHSDNKMTPAIVLGYAEPQIKAQAMEEIPALFAAGKLAEYEAAAAAFDERNYAFAGIYLLQDGELPSSAQVLTKETTVLGENDGYTFVLADFNYTVSDKDDPAIVEAAHARVEELIATMQFQPVVIPDEELGIYEIAVPNAFPTFTTQDLNGNTVDNSIFAQKDLTVINFWGTTCYPCIAEMPELQEWSKEMPENVQLIGLVLDVVAGDADALEMAQMICESTGVEYTNLMACVDMKDFLSNIIFTPTTLFVDSNGSVVGEPVTGAYVDKYKDFVESYLAQ